MKMDLVSHDAQVDATGVNAINSTLSENPAKISERQVLDAAFAELQSIEQDMGNQTSKVKKISVVGDTSDENAKEPDVETNMSINNEGESNIFSDAEESDVMVHGNESEGLIMDMGNKQIEPKILFSPTEPTKRTSSPSQVRSPLLNAQNAQKATASTSSGLSPNITGSVRGAEASKGSPIDNLRKRKMSGCSPYKITKRQAVVGLDDLISKLDSMIIASEKRQCEKMENLLAVRQESFLKEVKVENAKVLKKVKEEGIKTVKAVESLKKALEDHGNKIQKIELDLSGIQKKQNQDLSNTNKYIKKEVAAVESKIDTVKKDLENLEMVSKGQTETAKQSRTSIHNRIDDLAQKFEDLNNSLPGKIRLDQEEFPLNKTVVAKFVRQPEGEDILNIAKMVIHEFLELPSINIIKAKSMSKDEDGYGTIKILLEKPEDLSLVLQNKQALSEYDEDYDVKCIRIRQSKSKEQLVLELNCDMILKTLELQDNFWRHDNGWLIPRKPSAGKGRGDNFRGRQQNYRGINGKLGKDEDVDVAIEWRTMVVILPAELHGKLDQKIRRGEFQEER